MRTWVVVAAMVAGGCNPLKSDFESLCNAESRSGSMGKTPEDYDNALRWADRAMKTQEARGVVARLRGMSDYDKGTFLRQEAANAGVSACPLADSWAPLH